MATTIYSSHEQRAIEYWAEIFSVIGLTQSTDAVLAFEMLASQPQRPVRVKNRSAKMYGFDGINSASWREWVDKRVVNFLETFEFDVPVRRYEFTEAQDSDDPLVDPLSRSDEFVKGFLRWRTNFCAEKLLAADALSIDGQNFFDEEHEHLDKELGTYSNILAVDRAAAGEPTPSEVADEFEAATNRLDLNRLRPADVEVVQTTPAAAASDRRYVVLTTDRATRAAYRRLAREQDLVRPGIAAGSSARVNNPYLGAFSLLHVEKGAAPQSTVVIRADPGGPRPVMYARVTDPMGIKFREPDFEHQEEDLVYGDSARGGARAAFAETAVRVDVNP